MERGGSDRTQRPAPLAGAAVPTHSTAAVGGADAAVGARRGGVYRPDTRHGQCAVEAAAAAHANNEAAAKGRQRWRPNKTRLVLRLTLSHIHAWDTEHLYRGGLMITKVADQWEDVF